MTIRITFTDAQGEWVSIITNDLDESSDKTYHSVLKFSISHICGGDHDLCRFLQRRTGNSILIKIENNAIFSTNTLEIHSFWCASQRFSITLKERQ